MQISGIQPGVVFSYRYPSYSTGLYKITNVSAEGFFIYPFGGSWQELKILGCFDLEYNNFIDFLSPVVDNMIVWEKKNNILNFYK